MYPQSAFNHLHRFVVINLERETIIEGAYAESSAIKAVTILNDHERRNHRPPVYHYKQVTEEEMRQLIKRLSDQTFPENWRKPNEY